MFQNVLMTVTPLSEIKKEINCWENRPFMHNWPESNQHKKINKDSVNRTIKKKNKRNRTAYTTDQLRVLEKTFASTKYVDAERRKELADNLKIGEKCVKVWFQNRRMKEKKECPESSNDSSSDCVAHGWHESVTPPPKNSIQYSHEDQYVQQNNCYIEQTIHSNNRMEQQPYYYTNEQNCKTIQPTYGVGYHAMTYVPYAYESYSMPQNSNGYFFNDTTVYPTQYYPCPAGPEFPEYNMYTNMENSQFVQDQQNKSEIPNLSDLNYF